jgi:hypothetical protein
LAQARTGEISPQTVATELNISLSRFYQLRTDDLRACAHGQAQSWSPGLSGGDHQPDWSDEVCALLTKLLSAKPPSSYSAAASELLRRRHFKTDRASVRRWAIENNLCPDTRYQPLAKPVKRWQARDYGALWQYDATPHAFLPDSSDKPVLLDLLDDATRYNTGARLYRTETLLAHLDFLSRAFQAQGLPLALYVDYHSFFFTHSPDATSQRPNRTPPRLLAKTSATTPGRRRHPPTPPRQPIARSTAAARQPARNPSGTRRLTPSGPPASPG